MINRSEKQTRHYRQQQRRSRLAGVMISAGGYGIIASVVGILLFLIYQSLPLSRRAQITSLFEFALPSPTAEVLLTGSDPYLQVIYVLDRNGRMQFLSSDSLRILREEQLPLIGQEKILSAAQAGHDLTGFAVGTDSGRIITAEVRFKFNYLPRRGGRDLPQGREVRPELRLLNVWKASADTLPNHVEKLAYQQSDDGRQLWCWLDHQGRAWLRSLDEDEEEQVTDLSALIPAATPSALAISPGAGNLVIATTGGQAYWFNIADPSEVLLKDRWAAADAPISALEYLIGGQAIVSGTGGGAIDTWMAVRTPANLFKMRRVHRFAGLSGAITGIAVSPRNRNFLAVDDRGEAQLNYSTSGESRLTFRPSRYPIAALAFSPKANALVAVDTHRRFTLYQLDDPHPEATLKTLFGRVWYEGYPQPEFVWQSTGGSDEFEPKFSLIPLIFGTFKGTLYALLFSIPIALLAAVYVSQFAPSRLGRVVKPTVEIMAALPSVVIGFLAGLYFSPLFEEHLMAIMLFTICLPLLFLLFVILWRQLPEEKRVGLPRGWELYLSLAVLLMTVFVAAALAHPIETWLFDGSFQQWLYQALNVTYETRNSMVVGFALGFAVIPIIFTVAEDALSNVPQSLTSAALALGASRWQTVRRIVIPAASGGIFAAIMLGMGRAVGETMIVLMATGNTPVLDWLPFSGFRAMSACIAVEMPEAPVGGTLYRLLFFTGLLLFIFTFVLNTVSSLIGERLRKKYARF